LTRSKPVNLQGQPETRAIRQKSERDLFFFKCVFSPTLDPSFSYIFKLVTNSFHSSLYKYYNNVFFSMWDLKYFSIYLCFVNMR
jgi:hypothetical protein